jgi:hypothetical protein
VKDVLATLGPYIVVLFTATLAALAALTIALVRDLRLSTQLCPPRLRRHNRLASGCRRAIGDKPVSAQKISI